MRMTRPRENVPISDAGMPEHVEDGTPASGESDLFRELTCRLVVWSAVAAWTAALFAVVRSDYLSFSLARYDLGNMVQAVWSTAHGRPLEVTLATGEQAPRLAAHVDPILALLAPAWLVWPSPLLLAFVQIAVCALGALPVFWLARKHLGSEAAGALMALLYLAYPWLAWSALDAMHPVTLAIPCFMYAIWFLDEGKLARFALCAVFVLMTGELMGLTLAFLGLWYWLARGHRRAGLAIALAGFAWSAIAVKVIVPHFRGAESPFYGYYERVGGSPEGVIRTLLTDPGTIASELASHSNVSFLLLLGFPLAGLFFLAPGLAAVSAPQLLAVGLSEGTLGTDPRHHYTAAIIPFLIAATALGLARLAPRMRNLVILTLISLSIVTTALVAPWPNAPWADRVLGEAAQKDLTYSYVKNRYGARHTSALREAVEKIPADAPVSSTNKAALRLSARRYVYSVPILGRAEWVLLDAQDPWILRKEGHEGGLDGSVVRRLEERLRSSPNWRIVFNMDDVLVFERVR